MVLQLSKMTKKKSNMIMVYFILRLIFDFCHLTEEMAQFESFDGQIQCVMKSPSIFTYWGIAKSAKNDTLVWATTEELHL